VWDYRKQSGVTLVELIVALGLGVVVSCIAIQLYLVHSGVLHISKSLSQIQEQGRYAQQLLSAQLKMSGYGNAASSLAPFYFSKRSDGVNNDVLGIQMLKDGSDCMGGILDDRAGVLWKQFYVKDQTLLCKDSDGISAPVIQNVEAFQIVYGVDLDDSIATDDGFGSADVYVDGSALLGDASVNVVSVRVSLTLKSDSKVAFRTDEQPQERVWVLTQYIPNRFSVSTDGYLRRLFIGTTSLRNQHHRFSIE